MRPGTVLKFTRGEYLLLESSVDAEGVHLAILMDRYRRAANPFVVVNFRDGDTEWYMGHHCRKLSRAMRNYCKRAEAIGVTVLNLQD